MHCLFEDDSILPVARGSRTSRMSRQQTQDLEAARASRHSATSRASTAPLPAPHSASRLAVASRVESCASGKSKSLFGLVAKNPVRLSADGRSSGDTTCSSQTVERSQKSVRLRLGRSIRLDEFLSKRPSEENAESDRNKTVNTMPIDI